jgi:hypothetical protein
MEAQKDLDKWLKFLNPENLKDNLMFSSLYVAFFEAFKDYVIEEVKFFYISGFKNHKYIISKEYETEVKSKDKSIVKATLIWLKEHNAIEENDITIFEELLQYRNKLSHELLELLFEGLPEQLPVKLIQLVDLRIKIERWWILNIEIPTNPDFDASMEIKEEDITTHSQMFSKLLFDMLSGDEKTANYYQNEFKNKFAKQNEKN